MSVLDTARQLLPEWVGWAPFFVYIPLAILAACLCTWASSAIAMRPLLRTNPEHWAERARLAFPARTVAGFNLLFLPLALGAIGSLFAGPWFAWGKVTLMGPAAAGAFVGAAIIRSRTHRKIGLPVEPLGRQIKNAITVLLSVFPHIAVGVVALIFVPADFCAATFVVIGLAGAATVPLTAGWGLQLVQFLGLAQPASEKLQRSVDVASERVGIRPRRIYEVKWSRPNAFAYPPGKILVFTAGAVEHLEEGELAVICAHELGHLLEPRWVIWLRVAVAALSIMILVAIKPVSFTFGTLPMLIMIFCEVVAIHFLKRTFSKMEQRADEMGSRHEDDAGTYARALEKIYRFHLMPAVMSGRSLTHPHLYDRMTAAGVTPDYQRPAPPSRKRIFSSILVSALLAAFIAGIIRIGLLFILLISGGPSQVNETTFLLTSAPYGGGAFETYRLARRRHCQGRIDEAIPFYRAAAYLNPERPHYLARLAIALAQSGDCDGAERELSEAVRSGQPLTSRLLDSASRWVQVCRSE